MKLSRTIASFLIVLLGGIAVFAQSMNGSPLPPPTGMVNDYANIIDDIAEAKIEQKLRDYKNKSNGSVEIAVVTVKTTGERPIFDYSLAVARGWKIGAKDDDNPSALLLIAVDDRKYFTQISKDLEDELTDGIAGQLQRKYLVPAFKAGNYAKGISDTIDAYLQTIEERKSNPDKKAQPASTKGEVFSGGTLICCIVIFIIVFVLISSFFSGGRKGGGGGSGNSRDRWRSGGFGGNTSKSSYIPPLIIWGGGGGGDSSSDWGSSGGGDSWGGFGGGGDFGGGGAGGDW